MPIGRLLTLAAYLATAPCVFAARATAQHPPSSLDEFFDRVVKLNAAQRADLDRGNVVGKLLGTADDRDVAAFAAIEINVPRSFFVQQAGDTTRLVRTSTHPAHVFSRPPSEPDVTDIQLSPDDVKDLHDCRPNDCNFKLPKSAMLAVQALDLTGAGAPARATEFARRALLDYVADYARRGNPAMVVFDDENGLRASDALAALIADSSLVYRIAPSVGRFLTEYPHDSIAGASENIYWAVDDLPHVRQVLRIMHQIVYSPPELPGASMVASKQLYADHYFEAGLETMTAVDRPTATGNAITVVAIRRYRFDHLPGGGPLNIRGRVKNGIEDNLQADLVRIKRDCESAWRGQANSSRVSTRR